MVDLLTYLMADCPAVASVDGQAALTHMREKLAKNPPASLFYMPDGPAVCLTGGERLVLCEAPATTVAPRAVASLSIPAQRGSPEKSQTTSKRPVAAVIRPPDK